MQVLVYTYDKSDRNLPGFAYLFNKYWSPYVRVDVLHYRYPPVLPMNFKHNCLAPVCDKPFTYHLHRWIEKNAEDYFVFIGDDHWLCDYVDLGAVAMLEGAVKNGASKANLSADGLFHFMQRKFAGELVASMSEKGPINWRGSLQPAIWRKDYLLAFLDPKGISPWDVEERGKPLTNNEWDRVVSVTTHVVYPMTGGEGVQHGGNSFPPNILRHKPADLAALKGVGYPDIERGDLRWELV